MSRFDATSKRMLRRLGREITLQNQSAQTDANGSVERDDHGNVVWTDPVETTAMAEVIQRGTPSYRRRVEGIDSNADVIAWVDADTTLTDGVGDEATRATRIKDSGDTFVVRDTFHENNGLVRAHAVKEA